VLDEAGLHLYLGEDADPATGGRRSFEQPGQAELPKWRLRRGDLDALRAMQHGLGKGSEPLVFLMEAMGDR